MSEAHKAGIDWISSVVSDEGISCDLEKTTGCALPQPCLSHCSTIVSCLVAFVRLAAGGLGAAFWQCILLCFATTTYGMFGHGWGPG